MRQYVVDAFTDKIFHGNQAAVCVLEKQLADDLALNIARENNFSETAFVAKSNDGYDLRWFTPGGEIDLCGHATLGAAFVLFRFYDKNAERVVFHTKSGDLFVSRRDDYLEMDFPTYRLTEVPVTDQMEEAFGRRPAEAYIDRDLLLVYEDESMVREMTPDFGKVVLLDGKGVGVTAPGRDYDCVSRFFDPKLRVNEDPATGSAHCMIAPYWSRRLGKKQIKAYQASERGGDLLCELRGDRVALMGKAVLFSEAELYLPE